MTRRPRLRLRRATPPDPGAPASGGAPAPATGPGPDTGQVPAARTSPPAPAPGGAPAPATRPGPATTTAPGGTATPPAPAPDDATAPAPGRVAELLGTFGSLLSLFTAVLFYFGWASTDAETKALGLRDNLFRLSTADYLLRSVNALYLPVLVAAVLAFGAYAGHRRVPEPVVRGMRWAWVGALGAVGVYPLAPGVGEVAVPLAVLVGVLLTAYARTRDAPRPRLWALALLLAVVALFWSVYAYAGIVGRGRAADTARSVAGGLPAVVVFSEKDLLIRGGGSCLSLVAEKGSPYRYRYAGLRLFHVSGDRLYLVPRHWAPWDGTLHVLEDKGDKMRLEYVSGRAYRSRECP
ncbi:hypothetical protein ACH44C_14770 [Streptomyces purpureus]|uniref:hypothetical protein n=1 Tax=Streptomyces purpureus TaxID=1951 RepID=UPI00379D4D2D